MSIHLGKKIQEVLYRNRESVQGFAKRIHKTRSAIYYIFKREHMDTGLLAQISKLLGHDFFRYMMQEQYEADPEAPMHRPRKIIADLKNQVQQQKKELAELREKLDLLQKYNTLLEERAKKGK